jgi:hypothetical protein
MIGEVSRPSMINTVIAAAMAASLSAAPAFAQA